MHLYDYSAEETESDIDHLLVNRDLEPGEEVQISVETLTDARVDAEVLERFKKAMCIVVSDRKAGSSAQDYRTTTIYGDNRGESAYVAPFTASKPESACTIEVKNFGGAKAPVLVITNQSGQKTRLTAGVKDIPKNYVRWADHAYAVLPDETVMD